MKTSRVALGSVSTLAAAGLLLGAAPLLFNHAWGTSASKPWGTISSFSGSLSTSTPSDGDRSQLLRLAALKGSKVETGQSDPAMAAAAQLAVVQPTAAPAAGPPISSPTTAASSPETADPAIPPFSPEPPAGDEARQMASAEPTADGASEADDVPLPPASPARGIVSLININTASSDTLDRFAGAGRIGHAIVSHRPYRSIEDLVRRRVLRTRDFAKIQNRISVD